MRFFYMINAGHLESFEGVFLLLGLTDKEVLWKTTAMGRIEKITKYPTYASKKIFNRLRNINLVMHLYR